MKSCVCSGGKGAALSSSELEHIKLVRHSTESFSAGQSSSQVPRKRKLVRFAAISIALTSPTALSNIWLKLRPGRWFLFQFRGGAVVLNFYYVRGTLHQKIKSRMPGITWGLFKISSIKEHF